MVKFRTGNFWEGMGTFSTLNLVLKHTVEIWKISWQYVLKSSFTPQAIFISFFLWYLEEFHQFSLIVAHLEGIFLRMQCKNVQASCGQILFNTLQFELAVWRFWFFSLCLLWQYHNLFLINYCSPTPWKNSFLSCFSLLPVSVRMKYLLKSTVKAAVSPYL